MSRNQSDNTPEIGDEAVSDAPVGRMRLLPTVVFGVRASALARVALPVAVLTTGLVAGGPAAAADMGTMNITCCPPIN